MIPFSMRIPNYNLLQVRYRFAHMSAQPLEDWGLTFSIPDRLWVDADGDLVDDTALCKLFKIDDAIYFPWLFHFNPPVDTGE
jgi:hypothetical protein